ncbi:SDR family NAD(P)-dependent oxidoreductase [Kineosporia succinea]|uniref:NAD(P)-dependent dehydrogenase (Short-subunit alcohol dehydrogenase family) n=1 Tax=Kineosporia succinea TaxID=84632 RepID=A0ABT9PC10_9ACTN|nr:SDR family oxidoreductase [Kineosporia succinea]MDP9830242.1 NAD(P)-dependent dehydrogenase (short-subunit alcohol dehydrogenase family) [Kineosporia succinea]
MTKLDGKIAVITGGTSGMALETAALFAANGAHVYITGRDKTRLDRAVAGLEAAHPGSVTGVQADSGVPADLDALFRTVAEKHGRVDVLYACAGIGSLSEPLEEVTGASFDEVFAVNVRGTLLTVQKALPLMGAGGSIVLNGSGGSVRGVPGSTVYAASKAALRSFVRVWTAEWGPRDLRVNLLNPGPIATDVVNRIPAGVIEQIVNGVPAGRMGLPSEIASAVLFLASDDSRFVRGSELFVDGGFAQV